MRLAYEQGLLSHKGLNFFQNWALLYYLYLDRRLKVEDRAAELEQQTFNLYPERWAELYRDQLLGKLQIPNEEGEIPLTEDDLDDLDKFMERLERGGQFTMSGGDAAPDFPRNWGAWQ